MSTSRPPNLSVHLARRAHAVLGIDPRSLAAGRIALGLLLLVDLADRGRDLIGMYSDQGMLPSALIRARWDSPLRWSLHFLDGSPGFQAMLFVVAAVLALLLLLGCWTRLATIGCWVLLVSLQNRLPLVNNGGDSLLRLLLFWAMFLPLGRVWSFDAWRRARRGLADSAPRRMVFSVATAAILLQLAVAYWMSGFFKYHDLWKDGQAMYYVLSMDSYGRPLGRKLLEYPQLVQWLSQATLYLELIGPPLAFVPWQTGKIRLAVIAAFVALHTGIELCLTVGLFSYVSLAGWLFFLPGGFWDTVAGCCRKRLEPNPGGEQGLLPGATGSRTPAPHRRWRLAGQWTVNLVCLALLVYMLTWNLATSREKDNPVSRYGPRFYAVMPRRLVPLGEATLLGQRWNMFSHPPQSDGWYTARARLVDGRYVDLLSGGPGRESTEPPEHPAAVFPNHRWRKLFSAMTRQRFAEFREPVARFLVRRWNEAHGPSEQVESFQFDYTRERTLLDEEGEELIVHRFYTQGGEDDWKTLPMAPP